MKKFLAVLAILLFTHCSVMAESVIVSHNRAGGVVSVTRGAGMPMTPNQAYNRRPNYRACSNCSGSRYKRPCRYGHVAETTHYKRPYDRTSQHRKAMTRNMRMKLALEAEKLAAANTAKPQISATTSNKSTSAAKTPKVYRRYGVTYFN
ncbi:MAG: hypothetical protein NC191_02210 [Muribaculaceae bacterium]|nr:hypothetical protein [Muribaculaceae bacterium]